MEEWRNAFMVGGAVFIGSCIFFLIFGSADIQPWNNKTEDEIEDAMPINQIKH